ncbi:hypothetical protein A3A38_00260 [Candidatus Kaiserbacteria bacterium RIFCSPLOWO2_01_FULL_53_17]|uniref:Aminoglycoside phosphotransferase domain-containing protein n=1 Tax=Candidatus Kaiserbacteria bacterium RIFCSPLOWO2_01_FULL_53_17 TaxID=1798511 RepID=A0A1F6EG76_9BACT|nr:MAG: hypothetical protein A3A38_00260 [Candidatus Kaiserbacteria bacterium RIFCSPLOWO2_01_FULL_53_17]
MNNTVLITTSGVGERLGDLTKYTNKALVRIGTKPAISHIIESYPTGTRFVVTLGYFGEQVRDFLSLAYPKLNIKYVNVNPFVGPGSSLGQSMLQAKSVLQRPFIYHASDTLVSDPIPTPKRNWIGVYRGSDTSHYASWTMQEGTLRFHEKGAIGADFIHIGLVGVHDFKKFWKTLGQLIDENPDNDSLNDAKVLARIIESGESVEIIEFPSWRDIGNVVALRQALGKKDPEVLYKPEEAIFLFDTFVIKFFANAEVAAHRAERAKLLKGFVPRLEGLRGNFYRYTYVQGEAYPDVVNTRDFKKYLSWAQKDFWGKPLREVDDKKFKEVCRAFYEDKTKARVEKFFAQSGLHDTVHVINGESVPTLEKMLAQVDFKELSKGLQSRFHGDFVLDNVIRTKDGYCLVDWRQDFGGLLTVGDRYYDLAKLNHNLTVNHEIINRNLFTVDAKGKNILCTIMRPSSLVECREVFRSFLDKNKYDASKVDILTAIIWLNMAPLHHHPFNLFLYYFGKLHLWRALQAKK